jgi:quercetin dioxygenase-like cupin family protein
MAQLRLENRHTGEVLTLRRTVLHGEAVLELRGTLPPESPGPPLHTHYAEHEEGAVTAGTISADVGGRQIQAAPGETVQLPRGVPHRWWNQGQAPLAFEGLVRPVVDLDRYLQAIFEVMNAGPPNRPPLFYLAHVSLRHRKTQQVHVLPGWLQTPFFALLVGVGTLLGRYRGTNWPGCPARCSGAPGEAGKPGSTAGESAA